MHFFAFPTSFSPRDVWNIQDLTCFQGLENKENKDLREPCVAQQWRRLVREEVLWAHMLYSFPLMLSVSILTSFILDDVLYCNWRQTHTG